MAPALATVASWGGNSSDEPVPAQFSEDAFALEFTIRYGADWSYVAAWGQWLTWTGARWERETTLRAFDLARLVCRDSAATCPKPSIKARLSSASTVAAVERLARADRRHAATSDRGIAIRGCSTRREASSTFAPANCCPTTGRSP